MARDDASDQCCLKMADVKGLVEAIHAIKSPNKNQVNLCMLTEPLPCRPSCVTEAFTQDCPPLAALHAVCQPRWPLPEMGRQLQGHAVLNVASLRGAL